MASADYDPKVIMITGGAGFIASHVVIHFVNKYPDVTVINFDKLDYCSSLRNLSSLQGKPNYEFVRGDICSSDLVNFVIKKFKVDTIMHFAAQTHVDNAFGNAIAFTRNNVEGSHVLLEAALALRQQIRRFIFVSSDEVYGQTTDVKLAEDAPLRPTQPYAATKAAAEMMASAYRLSYGLPIIITRGNNVYGPHQFPEKVIPKFINLLMRGRALTLHGTGSAIRGFLHVRDVAHAFDVICHKGTLGEAYNIGTDFELTMKELAEMLVKRFGLTGEEADQAIVYVKDRPFNDCRYAITSKKLESLGWKPQIDWEQGLDETIAWYREYGPTAWGNIDLALEAHPRIGMVSKPVDLDVV
eukprot:TRINITY_DN807_c0_g1_i4.p1 TRINITY_DN807_c0_g1~~TRINITY_DN807_c0_g1_i4.p1  ORF type:complete len:356 (-),score=79.64 TRINITY_DN807_c0_g1_i4:218-1285(-)